MREDADGPGLDVTLDELHELFSSTREGLESREVAADLAEHYIGKN